MTDEVKPILSGDPKPDRVITVGAENKRDSSGDQTVIVKALKTFHRDGDMQGEMVGSSSPAFELPRWRAAQLRANGLIEYANEGDGHAIHGEVEAKRIDEKVKMQAELTKLPENSKGTPLRNPEIKMADFPAEQGNGKRK
jgi:hypothetical protein